MNQQYASLKNKFVNEIPKTKTLYAKQFEDTKRDPRKRWKIVKEIIGNPENEFNNTILRDEQGLLIADSELVANSLTTCFQQ